MQRRRKYTLKLLNRYLPMSACLMILSGCITPPPKMPNVPYQESLKTKCPVKLPRLNGVTGKDLAGPLINWIEIYSDCAARHNALVDEINKREGM